MGTYAKSPERREQLQYITDTDTDFSNLTSKVMSSSLSLSSVLRVVFMTPGIVIQYHSNIKHNNIII